MDEGIIYLNGNIFKTNPGFIVSLSVLQLALTFLFHLLPELTKELGGFFCFGLLLPFLGGVIFRVDDARPRVAEFVVESKDPKL